MERNLWYISPVVIVNHIFFKHNNNLPEEQRWNDRMFPWLFFAVGEKASRGIGNGLCA